MFITEHIVRGVLVDIYLNGQPYTRRHDGVLTQAGRDPKWGLDDFTRRLTGASTYGELLPKVRTDARMLKKRGSKKR